MVQIIINEQPIDILAELPKEIYSLSITTIGFMPIHPQTALLVRAWCREIKQNLTCEWIIVNGILVQVSDI